KIKAMQHAFGAEGVDPVSVDGGRGPRAVVKSELVLVGGGVGEGPKRIAGLRRETVDFFFVPDALEKNQLVIRDDRPTEAVANGFLPKDRRTVAAPGFRQIGCLTDAVTGGTEELWPVAVHGG